MKYKLEIIDSDVVCEIESDSIYFDMIAENIIKTIDRKSCYDVFAFQQDVILYQNDVEAARYRVNRENKPVYILETIEKENY